MLDMPRRPEGPLVQQVEDLFDLIWKLTEEVNRMQEGNK